jgi:hypothetical protein
MFTEDSKTVQNNQKYEYVFTVVTELIILGGYRGSITG